MSHLTLVPSKASMYTANSSPPWEFVVACVPEKMPNGDPFLVHFNHDDPANPKNWSPAKRWYLTMVSGLLVLNVSIASTAPSATVPILMYEFGFSQQVGNLVVSLFVAGYCVGPLLWGPLSEQYGRRPIFIITFSLYMCFQIGCALSHNTASILIFRFLGGVFAACPISNTGALLGDIWDPKRMGVGSAIFAMAPISGPGIGPVVGGYVAQSGMSWRWLFWILTAFAGVCWLMIILTLPETYVPVLLVKKARQMRKQTGDERYYAPLEVQELPWRQRLESILARPFKILFQEPMVFAITIYISFVYGCVYLLFEAYPIVFTEGHHMAPGPSGLTFLAIPLGGFIATITYIFLFKPGYDRKVDEFAPNRVPPEFRLEAAKYGGPLFAAAFFWFAWTSFPSVSIWAPVASGVLAGWGVCLIFLSLLSYIVDAYMIVSASALASNTVVRSAFGAAFPLFADQMFGKLGTQWASSLLGFIALAMTPIPFVLFKYGPTLRVRSKYAATLPPKSSSAV